MNNSGKLIRKKHTMSSSSNMNIIFFIPNDIVVEILSRVPANSLVRLRWACKYWFDLITRDDSFIKMHLHHHTITSTSTNDDDDGRIVSNTSLLLYYDYSPVVYAMNLRDIINNHDNHERTLSFVVPVMKDWYDSPYGNECFKLEFCGSCNGLVLLFHNGGRFDFPEYLLWNPCTRELRVLPDEPNKVYPVVGLDEYDYIVLGFIYDHTIDDYKVIRLRYRRNRKNAIDMKIDVYTLGSNSWSTQIVADPLLVAYWGKIGLYGENGLGLFVNGALHWMRQLQVGKDTIMSFDITKEELELREIEEPMFISNRSEFFLNLFKLHGCLCISQMHRVDKNLVVWMMNDYGVKDSSWTKLFTINMDKLHTNGPFTQYFKDGRILMVFGRYLIVSSDSEKNEARFIYSFQDLQYLEILRYGFAVESYIESLVSLKSGKYSAPWPAAGSRTPTVQKQDLLGHEVLARRMVRTSPERNGSRTPIVQEQDPLEFEVVPDSRQDHRGLVRTSPEQNKKKKKKNKRRKKKSQQILPHSAIHQNENHVHLSLSAIKIIFSCSLILSLVVVLFMYCTA